MLDVACSAILASLISNMMLQLALEKGAKIRLWEAETGCHQREF
jgi:hypothetical protein